MREPGPMVTRAAADPAQPADAGIARGAAVIAGLTIFSRVLGLVRTLVFAQTVGAGCLGGAYVTANQVPNLIYELVLGGALSSVMVPVLARSASRAMADPAEKERVGQITSALLTWSVIILVPLTILVAALAGPIASALTPVNASAHCVHSEVVSTTSRMMTIFAPQIILYGLAVVLYGLLQAYRRFAGPALGPALSSLVVIASYLAFASLAHGLPLGHLSPATELVLSGGTTLGIAALVVAGLVPTWRLHLRFRPVLRFPPGVARRAGGLAIVGVVELVAGDLSSVVAIALANGRGATGAIVIYNYGFQAFSSLHAVLAIAVATSAFPLLAAREGPAFDRTCAQSTRAVMLVSWLAVAILAAIAVPAADVLAHQHDQIPQLTLGFAMFAPGLAGAGIVANLSRVLLALGRLRVAAIAVAGSWLIATAADVILTEFAPARLVVAALALGNTIGQVVVAVPLVLVVRRIRGRAAIQGTAHAALAGLAAAAAAAAAGVAIGLALPASHKLVATGVAALAASVAVIVFGVVLYLLDDGDLRAGLARLRQGALARFMTR